MIVLGFNDTSILVGHFVSSPKEREKIDRRDSRRDERDRKEREKGMKVKKQKKLKHSPSTLTCYEDSRPCPTVSQYHLDALVTEDTRHLRTSQPSPAREIPMLIAQIP